jgi:DNA-binding MarR family transcriptional regulator
MPDAPVDTDDAAVELALAMKRLRARLRTEARPSEGWTISQLSALRRIVGGGQVTASRLARVEHVRPQSMAATVASLREGGLVMASPDPTDKRQTILRATPAGRKLVKARSESREAWLAAAIDDLRDQGRAEALVDAIALLNAIADWGVDAHADTRSRSRARA